MKDRIRQKANELFRRYGVKSITMDDIAKHLGMSKKTIYMHFKDKNALVVELMRLKMGNQVCEMDQCFTDSADAVNEVFFAVTHMRQMLSKMNPVLFYDLQKYHPEAWNYFVVFREKKLFEVISNNLKRGILEEFYRKEINIDILTWMRIGQIDTIFSQTTYPTDQFNILELMTEITEHFLYGLCTSKGHALINKYKQVTEVKLTSKP